MTKLVCITERLSLTKDKIYESDRFDGVCYYLADDRNIETWYHKNNFILLSELREQQIKSVLDD